MSGKYQAYPEYKDSGVEWLGSLPEDWCVSRIKWLASGVGKSFTDGDWIESPYITDRGLRLLQTGNIGIGEYKEKGFRYISQDTFINLNCTEVMPDDVLICRLADPVGRACLAPRLSSRMITSVDVCILKPKEGVDKQFVVYFLSSNEYLGHLNSSSRGGTRQRVSRSDLGDVAFALPDIQEQRAIAAFLDHETARIDRLIEKQQRLIELLREKRQAVISHAVTKGLDPNVPMKDSGVEWLGQVPEHWEVSQLKYEVQAGTSITYGIVQAGPHVEDGIPYIKTSDMSGESLPLDGYSKTSPEIDNAYRRSKVKEGDIVVAIRATVGKCLPVPKMLAGANLTQGTAKISPGTRIRSSFLLSFMSSQYVQTMLNSQAKGATFREITLDMLRRTPLLVPPLREQSYISSYVASTTERFDKLTRAAKKQQMLLQERRTALISAAVTGKIDVRNWRPDTSTQVVESDLPMAAEQAAEYRV